jgi:NAD(P)-dependent dehydrogenase (short-subunit alcohol dehydrogenase family)
VVGGTAGIGQFTAQKLVERTTPKKVIISGRNKQNGEEIVETLNKLGNTTNHEFIPCDITSMKNLHTYAEQVKSKIQKLNYLVVSAGIMSMSGRDETEEGIDKKMASHYYGRFKIIQELMPLLEAAADAGEDVRVMSVLAAGTCQIPNVNIFQDKKAISTKTIWT